MEAHGIAGTCCIHVYLFIVKRDIATAQQSSGGTMAPSVDFKAPNPYPCLILVPSMQRCLEDDIGGLKQQTPIRRDDAKS